MFGLSRLYLIAGGVLLLLVASNTWTWRTTVKHERNACAAKELAYQTKAAELLATETAKVKEIDAANRKLASDLETTYLEHSNALDAAYADNRRLAAAGKLRDPGRRPACKDAVPGNATAPGSAADDSAGSELSETLVDFFVSEARRADQAATYALTCHQWARALNPAP